MEPEYLLTPMRFSERITEYTLIPHNFKLFFEHGDLREQILRYRMRGLDELNDQWTPKMHPDKSPAEIEAVRWQQRQTLEANTAQKVDEYLPTLYDQALVMIVTVFDGFLYESLKTVTSKNPQLLKDLASRVNCTT